MSDPVTIARLRDKWFRYTNANKCPIFAIRIMPFNSRFTPMRGGNFGGFWLGPFRVIWRKPYSDVWGWNGLHWTPRHMMEGRS